MFVVYMMAPGYMRERVRGGELNPTERAWRLYLEFVTTEWSDTLIPEATHWTDWVYF